MCSAPLKRRYDDLREQTVQINACLTVAPSNCQGQCNSPPVSLGVAPGVGAQLFAEINVALGDARNCPGIDDVETRQHFIPQLARGAVAAGAATLFSPTCLLNPGAGEMYQRLVPVLRALQTQGKCARRQALELCKLLELTTCTPRREVVLRQLRKPDMYSTTEAGEMYMHRVALELSAGESASVAGNVLHDQSWRSVDNGNVSGEHVGGLGLDRHVLAVQVEDLGT